MSSSPLFEGSAAGPHVSSMNSFRCGVRFFHQCRGAVPTWRQSSATSCKTGLMTGYTTVPPAGPVTRLYPPHLDQELFHGVGGS
jgi:hypothetical protein